MDWIRNIFKKKVSYMYFKIVIDSYFGMCGTERTYIKTPKATGRLSSLDDMFIRKTLKSQGWIIIEKEEYECYIHHVNTLANALSVKD